MDSLSSPLLDQIPVAPQRIADEPYIEALLGTQAVSTPNPTGAYVSNFTLNTPTASTQPNFQIHTQPAVIPSTPVPQMQFTAPAHTAPPPTMVHTALLRTRNSECSFPVNVLYEQTQTDTEIVSAKFMMGPTGEPVCGWVTIPKSLASTSGSFTFAFGGSQTS